jgi:hypothetical protein
MKTKAIKTILKNHNKNVKARKHELFFTRWEVFFTSVVAVVFWELGKFLTDIIINVISK